MLAIDGDRCLLGRAGALRRQHVVVPCGLRRAGRDHRGGGAARDAGGGRHRLRRVNYFALAALAVSDVADDRLPRAGASNRTSRSTARNWRTRAGSRARRSRRCSCGQHPEGISIPPPIAIAHHIIRAWVEEGDGVFALNAKARALRRHRGGRPGFPRRRAFRGRTSKTQASEFRTVNGGNAANAAVAIAHLGARASFAGPLGGPAGADSVGDTILRARRATRASTAPPARA